MADKGVNFQGKRVCVVGPFPPRAGELSGQVELLCLALQREGAWVRRVNTDVPSVRRLPWIGVHLLPLAQIVLVAWRLLSAAPRSEVIHVCAASGWGFYLPVFMGTLAGRIYRKRVVITLSGGMGSEFLRRSWRRVLPMLDRADAIAVTSGYLQEVLGRYGKSALVIPNLIALEHYPFLARNTWPPLVLWIGSLDDSANPVMALRTLTALRKVVGDARLLMVGSGPLAKIVARTAMELGVANAVAYRPSLPEQQRQELLREASVLWHTATEDNLPQPLLEAAASGTVVISTDIGAVPELLHDGVDGLLVKPDDAARMAECTIRVLGRAFLAESLVNNARISAERYSWSGARRNVARLYGLVGDGGTSTGAARDGQDDGDDLGDLLSRTEFLLSDPNKHAASDQEPASRHRRR